ncbi:MAG: DUF3089 domain-containing protein [Acidimicrobiales bacterium]
MLLSIGALAAASPSGAAVSPRSTTRQAVNRASGSATVWLCRPGKSDDPCTASLATTVIQASGTKSVLNAQANTASKFDCFYVYPTVSTEATLNADLKIQPAEVDAAIGQASRFSTVCRVWSPMYRQITLAGLETYPTVSSPASVVAYDSIRAGFEDYLAHFNDGRPIIFIGHSQGAAMMILLLEHFVDNEASLRNRLVLAIILGGNVVVPTGKLEGGSFDHIPVCSAAGEKGCVIAYSSFPGEPPAGSLFGRAGQGVSLQSGQTATRGVQVVCVNPAAIGGKTALLEPYFPSEGLEATPWVEFPKLYSATCESAGGATWLQITKISGLSDHRPVVTETAGPDWGYHVADVNLALGNLVADVAAAEASFSKGERK